MNYHFLWWKLQSLHNKTSSSVISQNASCKFDPKTLTCFSHLLTHFLSFSYYYFNVHTLISFIYSYIYEEFYNL